ncbi:MAG: hypothetical protein HXY34_12320 [Candidatus Thorarchaeota archaeon]|nr:hypothetical protein [Candidatus Thorarchaeota archaeon]
MPSGSILRPLSGSFDRMGALWYNRASNSICSAIDGDVVTLGAVTNASRIVSYLVIRVLRYDDVAMVDLRVQDMELVVDLRGTPQWVPAPPPDEEAVGVECDGTKTGLSDNGCGEQVLSVEAIGDAILGAIEAVWNLVCFWPVLFISLIGEYYGSLFDILVTVDFIGSTKVERMSITVLSIQDQSDEAIQLMYANVWRLFDLLVFSGLVITAYLLEKGLDMLRYGSFSFPVLVGGILLWTTLFIGYLGLLNWCYNEGYQDAWENFIAVFVLYVLLVGGPTVVYGLTSFRLAYLLITSPVFLAFVAVILALDPHWLKMRAGYNLLLSVIEVWAIIMYIVYLVIWLGIAMRDEPIARG